MNIKTNGENPANLSQGLAEFLKSAAHPVRVHVLTLLTQGEHKFSVLMQQTKLSKTALANHMNHLVQMGLAQRVARGDYALTVDGKELLNAIVTVYRNSVRREEAQREALLNRYTKSMIEGKKMSKKVVSKEAVYQPCWLSYNGAMAGSLQSLGVNCDIVDVGGYSGYAFIINVSRGMTCPSGPTALPIGTWKQIHRGTEKLGWTIEHYEYPDSYPKKEGHPTPEEIEVAERLFVKIKQEIEQRDRPVVLWGLVVPEYGIVNGYEGDSYIVSTFRSLLKQPETPILFHDLKAPGCIDAFFFRDQVKADAKTIGKEAIENAVKFAIAKVPILDNYVAGPAALEEWASVLERGPEEKQNYHGNSYVGVCVAEGRAISAEFLKRLAEKHKGRQAKHLLNASESYENGAKLMEEFTRIFPVKFGGEMKIEDRKRGAGILRKTKLFEEEATRHMEKAVESWEN
jgi:DNA-binding HxlR family transcriptional regulator